MILRDIMLENTIIGKLRKHLEYYNFQEQHLFGLEELESQKIFALDIHENNQAKLAITHPRTILDDAWLIKIIDTFLSESLLLDTYSLKINYTKKELQELKTTLSVLSVSFVEQPQLPTNFEFSTRLNGQICILANGGRQKEQAIFANINIEKLLTLEQKITIPTSPTLSVIVPLNPEQNHLALLLAAILHQNGKCVDILLQTRSNSDNFEQARKMCAKYVLLLGKDEQKNGTVTIKNLHTGSIETVKQANAIAYLFC